MTAATPLYVLVAILLSSIVMIVTTETGLHRSPVCILPSLGITVMIWMAYPPAQALPPIVSILFWGLITYVMYHFPTGSTTSEEDALEDALLLWEERERRRVEILAAVDLAEASFARGEGRRVSTREEAARLADEIKQRGMARLIAEENDR